MHIKKKVSAIVIPLLILVIGIVIVYASVDFTKSYHSADEIFVTVKGFKMTLQNAVDEAFLNTQSTPSVDLVEVESFNPGHFASDFSITTDEGFTVTLQEFIAADYLKGGVISANSNSTTIHNIGEIRLASGESFQDIFLGGVLQCVPKTCEGICGPTDDGCAGTMDCGGCPSGDCVDNICVGVCVPGTVESISCDYMSTTNCRIYGNGNRTCNDLSAWDADVCTDYTDATMGTVYSCGMCDGDGTCDSVLTGSGDDACYWGAGGGLLWIYFCYSDPNLVFARSTTFFLNGDWTQVRADLSDLPVVSNPDPSDPSDPDPSDPYECDTTYYPLRSTVCEGVSFTQINDCGDTRTTTGTADCSGGGGCFTSDEEILSTKGYVKIKDIKVNDVVVSYDELANKFVTSVVDEIIVHNGVSSFVHSYKEYSLIKLVINVNGEIKTTEVTENHGYYNPILREYKQIKYFEIGDYVKTIDGFGVIQSKDVLIDDFSSLKDRQTVVYNIHMKEGPNNYLVNGIVVHNVKTVVDV